MSLSANVAEKANLIWAIADKLTGVYKPHEYGEVILPLTVIRRFDCILAATKQAVLKKAAATKVDYIKDGNTLSHDQFPGRTFDYILSNPPFGKDWKNIREEIEAEHARGAAGRYAPGLPDVGDGAMLFLLHKLSKLPPQGGKIAIIFNGSPLFNGDAGSGPSNIRKHLLENDWLDAIVAMPNDLFYNTGIATYI